MSNEYSEENTGKPEVFLLYKVVNGYMQLATILAGFMQNHLILLLELCGWVVLPSRKISQIETLSANNLHPPQFNIFRM
jgi:hypothetical protein